MDSKQYKLCNNNFPFQYFLPEAILRLRQTWKLTEALSFLFGGTKERREDEVDTHSLSRSSFGGHTHRLLSFYAEVTPLIFVIGRAWRWDHLFGFLTGCAEVNLLSVGAQSVYLGVCHDSHRLFRFGYGDRYIWNFSLFHWVNICPLQILGANDVVNSFADVVAAGTITLRQTVSPLPLIILHLITLFLSLFLSLKVIMASFTEFLGAFLLGNNTTSTIRSGIIDVALFSSRSLFSPLSLSVFLPLS